MCVQTPVHEFKVGDVAINRLRWAADGRHIAVGDAAGCVTILKIAAEVFRCCVQAVVCFCDVVFVLMCACAGGGDEGR